MIGPSLKAQRAQGQDGTRGLVGYAIDSIVVSVGSAELVAPVARSATDAASAHSGRKRQKQPAAGTAVDTAVSAHYSAMGNC